MYQKGNPVLKLIRGIPWEFGPTPADFHFSPTICALYLRQLVYIHCS